MKNRAAIQVSLSGYLSNTLEWFDFTVFAVFAPLLAQVFFPFASEQTGLLLTYASYGMGYCIRPLGGLVFGHLGDRLGRKSILITTLSLITMASLAIGFLPSYQQIGLLAPILLTLFRVLQGFSIGGETAGSLVYAFESASETNRGLLTTLVWVGSGSGLLLATLCRTLLMHGLSHSQMLSFGFRIPFFLSALTTIIIFRIRRKLSESKVFTDSLTQQSNTSSLLNKFTQNKLAIFAVILLFAPSGMMFNLLFIFVPQNINSALLPAHSVMTINTLCLIMIVTGSVFFGWLADKVDRQKMLLTSCLLALVCFLPLYHWLFANSLTDFAVAQFSLTLIVAFYSGAAAPIALSLLPIAARSTLLGTAYNITNGLISSTALTVFAFFHHSGFTAAPIIYVLLYFVAIIVTLRPNLQSRLVVNDG